MNLYQLLTKAITTDAFKNEGYDGVASAVSDLVNFYKSEAGTGRNNHTTSTELDLEKNISQIISVFDSCPYYPGLTCTRLMLFSIV